MFFAVMFVFLLLLPCPPNIYNLLFPEQQLNNPDTFFPLSLVTFVSNEKKKKTKKERKSKKHFEKKKQFLNFCFSFVHLSHFWDEIERSKKEIWKKNSPTKQNKKINKIQKKVTLKKIKTTKVSRIHGLFIRPRKNKKTTTKLNKYYYVVEVNQ
jgi:hypothetical protein